MTRDEHTEAAPLEEALAVDLLFWLEHPGVSQYVRDWVPGECAVVGEGRVSEQNHAVSVRPGPHPLRAAIDRRTGKAVRPLILW